MGRAEIIDEIKEVVRWIRGGLDFIEWFRQWLEGAGQKWSDLMHVVKPFCGYGEETMGRKTRTEAGKPRSTEIDSTAVVQAAA